jgi:uncharacterized Zn finger protein (UPF0148 family)
MPACERCGKWFPSSRGLLECPVCGGSVRSAKADPALRDFVRRTHESVEREERRIRELSRHQMPGPPLIPVEQAELDALLDLKAVREGKERVEIDDELKRQRAQEGRKEREELVGYSLLGCLLGSVFLGIAEIGPLVAFRALGSDDSGQLIVAATLISTPLVWVGAVVVLKRLWPRRYGSALLSRTVGLVIAWLWAGLFVFAASRLVA